MKKVRIGVVGCGSISHIYMKNIPSFNILELVACADAIPERAKAKAEEFGVARSCSVEDMLRDRGIDVIVNLTTPEAHAEVGLSVIGAGKNLYAEKPLAVTRQDGLKLLNAAAGKKVRLGSAPDTFLGGGIQTCRKLIDDGWIGTPVGGTASMMCRGHESWHPEPNFYYQPGGGPVFDMGPYYITALVNLLGPVRRVAAVAKRTFGERVITSRKKYGSVIKVNVNTHVAGTLEFVSGCTVTMIMSFDVPGKNTRGMELYGTAGSVSIPDPNTFAGPVYLFKPGYKEWKDMPLSHGYTENSRGLGVADMALAMIEKREHRANGEMAYHVLDVLHSFDESSESNRHVEIKSTCEKPLPMPAEGFAPA